MASEEPNFGSFVLASLFWGGFPFSSIPNFSIWNFFEMMSQKWQVFVNEFVVGFSFSSQKWEFHCTIRCYSVRFSCSPTSTKLDLHNETCVTLANL